MGSSISHPNSNKTDPKEKKTENGTDPKETAPNNGTEPKETAPEEPPSKVKITCDWLKKENTSQHRTDEYENDFLVLRRGDTFNVKLVFQEATLEQIMETVLLFKFEPAIGTNAFDVEDCALEESIDSSKWSMVLEDKNEELFQIVAKVNIPVTALVGRYVVEFTIPSQTSAPIQKSKIIVLFNPWNKDDDIYLEDEEQKKEYVLNDTGILYRGSTGRIRGITWNYGQFEAHVLDCVLHLLDSRKDRSLRAMKKRGSAVWVSRNLSSALSSLDNNGLLEGNWSGDYDDGKAPTSWNGSVQIFQNYFQTKKPVKYGQCWVFSGVMTTALRALGIPSRSITNFNSAHDTDRSMTIDKIVDKDGEPLDISHDSIWNFHVWNELWTKRADHASKNYDGWQVVDATPQEESFGRYQMGPAPVCAVKAGDVYIGFDCDFLFAEVNADYVKWVAEPNTYGKLIYQEVKYKNDHHIGKFLSTKMVGSNEREDVTSSYKHKESSEEERKVRQIALSYGVGMGRKNLLNFEEEKELTLDLDTTSEKYIPNGESFTCMIVIENTSENNLTLNVSGAIISASYTGKAKTLIKKQKFQEVRVDVGQKKTLEIDMKADDYANKLTSDNCLKFSAVAKVLGTGNLYVEDCNLLLYNKDCIEFIILNPPLKVGKDADVVIKFTNTLPQGLQKLEYTLEGPGLLQPTTQKREYLKTGEDQSVKFNPFKPTKAGKRTMSVDIDTQHAKDFKSSIDVNVEESE